MCVLILLTLLLVWCLIPVVFMPCKPLMVTCLVGGTGCCLLARVSAPLSTTKNLQPPNVGDSVGHQVSLDCFKAIRYQADSAARFLASMNCLTMSTKTGLSGSLERCSYSCQTHSLYLCLCQLVARRIALSKLSVRVISADQSVAGSVA